METEFFLLQPIIYTLKGVTLHSELFDFNDWLDSTFYFSTWEYLIEKHLVMSFPVTTKSEMLLQY